MKEVDLILSDGVVVTMDDNEHLYDRGAVAIADAQIVAVGEDAQITARYHAAEVIDCRGKVIIPGLVNTHTHVPMTLLRGLADDLRLDVWLHGYIIPVEKEFVNEDFCYYGTLLGSIEMIRGGVTCFADMYYYEDSIAQAAAEAGIRAVCAETIMKLPTPDSPSYDQTLEYCAQYIEKWRNHELVVPALGPHSVYMNTEDSLREVAAMARHYQVPILTHASETELEVVQSRELFGYTPPMWFDRCGIFDVHTLVAHGVALTTDDMMLLREKNVGVTHNPTSNLKLASGIADVQKMREQGVTVCIGTDGCSSNNDLDMFEELRLAALLSKGMRRDPTAIPARTAFAMATIEGARALGIGDMVGSLEPGKRADIAVLDFERTHLIPRFELTDDNVYSHLVYVAKGSDVVHTIVNGKLVMRNREVLSANEKEVLSWARDIAKNINVFLSERQEDLVAKLAMLGGVEQEETYEVQIKLPLRDRDPVRMEEFLNNRFAAVPTLQVVKHSERYQYDTYFVFENGSKGIIRYREDQIIEGPAEPATDEKTNRETEFLKPSYSLTLVEPPQEMEHQHTVILSRGRFTTSVFHSLRFYREYFRPDEIREVNKRRWRWRVQYKGVEFALNIDLLTASEQSTPYLEIKSRTWSKQDAIDKANLLVELLTIFGLSPENAVKSDYGMLISTS